MFTSGVFGYLFDYLLWWVLFLSLVIHTWCFFRYFPRTKFRKSGLLIGNLLVFNCLLGVLALAGESYFRFAAVETDSFGVSLPARRWFALYAKLNSVGCRDEEWTTKKPSNVRRIAFVGDSFTYGWGIKQPEDRFSDLIQPMFDARSPGTVEVMNVAKPGWGTDAELQPVQEIIDVFHVDEVVLCHVLNDIEELLPVESAFNPTRPPEPGFFNIDSSCLLDYLYRRLYVPRLAQVRGYEDWIAKAYENQEIMDAHRRNLEAVATVCRERGVTLRVALMPFVKTTGTGLDQAAIHKRLRHFLELHGIPVVDLLSALEGRSPNALVVNAKDAHPNEAAHVLFADAIWNAFFAP